MEDELRFGRCVTCGKLRMMRPYKHVGCPRCGSYRSRYAGRLNLWERAYLAVWTVRWAIIDDPGCRWYLHPIECLRGLKIGFFPLREDDDGKTFNRYDPKKGKGVACRVRYDWRGRRHVEAV